MKKIIGGVFLALLCSANVQAGPVCLDIENAGAKEIQKRLKGVGESKAKAIVNFREAKRKGIKTKKKTWNFNNWKTLLAVKGIGPKICEDNVGKVCFGLKKVAQKSCPPKAKDVKRKKGKKTIIKKKTK